MSESKKPESKKNPIINYIQESYEELKKVTWPTRNQAVKLTFIVIGFCIALAVLVGALDLVFNTGYRSLVNFSQKVAPAPVNPVSNVATGEPTSKIDLSNIKISPSPTPAPAAAPKAGSTQQ